MATCRDCDNHDECSKMKKIRIEIYDNGFLCYPKLCDYVEHICRWYKPKKGSKCL